MKSHHQKPFHAIRQGFTLIELLVVISIIGILAAMAMPAYTAVVTHARIVQARAVIMPIVAGIKGYQTEYNHYPAVNGTVTDGSDGPPVDTTNENKLMACLLGTDNTGSNATNPRGIVYLTPPTIKNGVNGYDSGTESSTAGSLIDPWKNPYHVMMDMNGDGMISNPYYGGLGVYSSEPKELLTGVIVYSNGPDGVSGAQNGAASSSSGSSSSGGPSYDDVLSWH